ncbi:MAG: cell division protein ZapA [Bacteroidales bacterium]|nr:cell division protein ZapA [Bacteroidales bacterium]MCQ2253785.1 cell division protein ZapA [Bacteroidales bacterium]
MGKQRITLNIDNHPYSMNVNSEDEERFRKAAELINGRIITYKNALQGGNDYTYLSYAVIDLVQNFLHNESKADDSELMSELRIMSNDIDEFIQNSQAL